MGGGKSTLIRKLFASLDPMAYLPIYLCHASLKPRDFYGGLLEAVGMEPVYTVSRARKLWQDVVKSRSAPGERTMVVVIDEAHEMSEAMLLELRFALNYNIDSSALFPLILVGQPELRKLLRLRKYEATFQRIGLQYHLSSMSKEETSAYIRHHLTVSRTEKPVFAESALSRIFAASHGLPRVVNQIAYRSSCWMPKLGISRSLKRRTSSGCWPTWTASAASRLDCSIPIIPNDWRVLPNVFGTHTPLLLVDGTLLE